MVNLHQGFDLTPVDLRNRKSIGLTVRSGMLVSCHNRNLDLYTLMVNPST